MKRTEIDAWISFIDDLSKVVVVDQHYSPPSKSCCGAPEGDPLSVVASVLMCLIWFIHVRKGMWCMMKTRFFLFQQPSWITGKFCMNIQQGWLKHNRDHLSSANFGSDIGFTEKLVLGIDLWIIQRTTSWGPPKTSDLCKQFGFIFPIHWWEPEKRPCRN